MEATETKTDMIRITRVELEDAGFRCVDGIWVDELFDGNMIGFLERNRVAQFANTIEAKRSEAESKPKPKLLGRSIRPTGMRQIYSDRS